MDEDNSILPYPPLPMSVCFNPKCATIDEKKLAKQIVDRFLKEAQAGNVYEAEAGIGSVHRTLFKIVSYGCGLGIQNVDSRFRPVKLNRQNAMRYIKSGAKLVAYYA